jgi:hypothetical protein
MAAARDEHHDDVIARREILDSRPEPLDDTGGFVPEHHRGRTRPVAVDDREIGMAQPGGGDAHEHLAWSRLGELDLADIERARLRVGALAPRRLEHRRADAHRPARQSSLKPCART